METRRRSPEHIIAWIDLTGLFPTDQKVDESVLNGIGYDAEKDRLFVTGKHWPAIYEIKIVPRANRENSSYAPPTSGAARRPTPS